MKDHFVIIGAQRSGTTYLYDILEQHPEICMSIPKKPEPKYFLGKSKEELNLKEYIDKYFINSNNSIKIFGEKSTSYYERKESAMLINALLPKAKILIILRNPIQRALSNYFFSVNNGLETRTLEEVFILNKKAPNNSSIRFISVNPFNYLGRGEYHKYIKRYRRYFDSSKIKIILFEELVNNKQKIVELYSYLGVDKTFRPINIEIPVNSSGLQNSISKEILEFLKSYYVEHNKKLEKISGLKLDLWS